MKINIWIKILDCFLFLVYLFLITMTPLKRAWFSIFMIFFSIPLFFKSAFFVQDSKLWAGCFLLLCGTFGVYLNLYDLPLSVYYPIYILIFGLSSFIVFALFRQNIHLKVFVLCFLQVLLLCIYKFAYISLIDFIILQIAFALFVLTRLLIRAKINTRSN